DDQLDVTVGREGEQDLMLTGPADAVAAGLARVRALGLPVGAPAGARFALRPELVAQLRAATLRETVEMLKARLDNLGVRARVALAGEIVIVDVPHVAAFEH